MAKKFATLGLGNFGFYFTKTLFEDGNDVVAVDRNEDRIQKIRPYCSQAILGDVTQKELINTLGIELEVKRIVVKATDEDHGKILLRVGATDVIHPEKDMAVKVARSLSNPDMLDYFPMSGEYIIAEIAPIDAFVGRSLAELQLRSKYNINVVGIKELVPENFILVPPADFVIKDSDILLAIGKSGDITKIKKMKVE